MYLALSLILCFAQAVVDNPGVRGTCYDKGEAQKMSKGRDRTISRRKDGRWENKRNDAEKASSVHDTQKDAIASAKSMLKKQG